MIARIRTTTLLALTMLLMAACTTGSRNMAKLDYDPPADGQLRVVRGVLETNPAAEEPSMLMRTHYYLLNGHRVFTGGDRLPGLEERTGKMVALTGWVVEMELEGKSFKEIRPVSVETLE